MLDGDGADDGVEGAELAETDGTGLGLEELGAGLAGLDGTAGLLTTGVGPAADREFVDV